MRIRTRHKLFKLLMLLAVLNFAFSLYDNYQLEQEFQVPVLLAYGVLAVLALLLYLGYKPDLSPEEPVITEEVVARPAEEEPAPELLEPETAYEAVEVEEVPKPKPATASGDLRGRHAFRCPFCSNTFALESTHAGRAKDFRMSCPFCANNIRIPHRPKVTKGDMRALSSAPPSERVLYACRNCGEVLRFTAPGSRLRQAFSIVTCPHCESRHLVPAAPS